MPAQPPSSLLKPADSPPKTTNKQNKTKQTPNQSPHPWAPNKPPLNLLANATAAPLDALLDLWRFGGAPPS